MLLGQKLIQAIAEQGHTRNSDNRIGPNLVLTWI